MENLVVENGNNRYNIEKNVILLCVKGKEAVKIHVEFYSFLCIIEVAETI